MAAVGEDDAAWERAIDAATKAATSGPKTLTLDGAVKSSTGRLPSPALFERFAASLEELSVAGARLSSLEGLPRLPALRRLSLPDNRLSGAAAVAEACGATLRHLDLGNNRFAEVKELEPLAKLGVEALDLEQCPVSKVKGYREKVFALIPSLKYLDGADAQGNERLETDDEDYVEEEDDEEGEEEGEDGEGEEEEDGEGVEDDGEEGDEGDEEHGQGDDDEEEEEEEGDEEAEDEEDEADDDGLDADADDKENIESKAGSSLPNKRKRDNDDDTNGDD